MLTVPAHFRSPGRGAVESQLIHRRRTGRWRGRAKRARAFGRWGRRSGR